MRTKKGNITFYFLIDETSYKRLKLEVQANNIKNPAGKSHLNLDAACFLLFYVQYQQATSDKKDKYGYVKLSSQILKGFIYKYDVYRDFLELKGFLRINTLFKRSDEAMSYKVILPSNKGKILTLSYQDFRLKKKLRQKWDEITRKADSKTSHLTKWIDGKYLKIEYEDALRYIESAKMSYGEKHNRRIVVEYLKNGSLSYSRNGADNRLHSILTRMPKDLRKYVRFEDKYLVSLDIKSSQPFILAGILNILFLNPDAEKVEKVIEMIKKVVIRNNIRKDMSIIKQKPMETLDIREIKKFVNLVTQGDIYEYIGENLSESFLREIKTPLGIIDTFYDPNLGYRITKDFNTLREYCKQGMLEFLYCSPKSKEARYREIKTILPALVVDLISMLKATEKNYFPIFLQNVEANLILDVITKRIAQDRPEIPLYTVHDSIVTTIEYSDYVEENLKSGLREYFGITPTIKKEDWFDSYLRAA